MAELIARLDAPVWIVSGGLEDVLYPVADHLGVPRERVLGTRVEWAPDGDLVSVEGGRQADAGRRRRGGLAAAARGPWATA